MEAFEKSGQSLKDFARAWGVNEQVLGRWAKAYRTAGPKALAEKRMGRKPGRNPVDQALREGIKKLKTDFPDLGLRKVQGFLARFKGLKASTPVIRRVVKEEDLPKDKSAPSKWKKTPLPRRFERSRPGELWQTDITSFNLARHSQKVYLVAFMDDHSRYVVSWRLGLQQTTDFVQEALLGGIQRFGKPKELLSDQGRQYHTWRGTGSFRQLLDRQGINHILSRPKHPQTVGKCERFWKTVGEEFWARVQPQELHEAQERLGYFINHYNHFRPHQGLDNAVPADPFFGAEDQVRLGLEAAWKQNQLSKAVVEPSRQRVFLVGQFGDQFVSLHGERAKLILRTSEGVRQELVAADLGMAQAFPLPLEKQHGNLDGSNAQREHADAPEETPQAGGQAEVGPPPFPVRAIWELATETQRQEAHKLGVLMLELWLGRMTRKSLGEQLNLPPLRVWQLGQQALAGMVVGLMAQPKRPPKGTPMAAEKKAEKDELKMLRKQVYDLQQDNRVLKELLDVLKDLPSQTAAPEAPKGEKSSSTMHTPTSSSRIGAWLRGPSRKPGDRTRVAQHLGLGERTLTRWQGVAVPKKTGRPPHSQQELEEAKSRVLAVLQTVCFRAGWTTVKAFLQHLPKRVIDMALKVLKAAHRIEEARRLRQQSLHVKVLIKGALLAQDITHVGSFRGRKAWAEVAKDAATCEAWAFGNGKAITGEAMLVNLETLKAQGRLPLVLATDNGSAYKEQRVRAWLA